MEMSAVVGGGIKKEFDEERREIEREREGKKASYEGKTRDCGFV